MMSRRAAEFSRAFSRRPRSTRTRLVDGGTVLVRAICGRPTETDRAQYCETFAWFMACPERSLLDGRATVLQPYRRALRHEQSTPPRPARWSTKDRQGGRLLPSA